MKKIGYDNKGQTLVTLLFFMVIAITIVSAAVVTITASATGSSRQMIGDRAYYLAESGIENALLLLLRDPSYTGETLTLESGTIDITISGTDTKTITSTGKTGDHMRTIEATATYTDNILTVISWREVLL